MSRGLQLELYDSTPTGYLRTVYIEPKRCIVVIIQDNFGNCIDLEIFNLNKDTYDVEYNKLGS